MDGPDADEIGRSRERQHSHPERRGNWIGAGGDGGNGPQGSDNHGDGTSLNHANGVHGSNWNEGQRHKERDDEQRQVGPRHEGEEIEADEVLDGGEAEKIAVLGLALLVGHVEQARRCRKASGRLPATPTRRASGPSTVSTMRARPSQLNMHCQSPRVAAINASSANTAPVAVRRWTAAALKRSLMRASLPDARGRHNDEKSGSLKRRRRMMPS